MLTKGRLAQLLIGAVGLFELSINLGSYLSVLSAPGDDDSLAKAATLGAACALVPCWGFARGLLDHPLERGRLWLMAALLALVPATLATAVFVSMWLSD
jgi:hypothetical protein